MYSVVTTLHNSVLYIQKLIKRVDLKSVQHKKNFFNYLCWWMLIRFIVVII